MNNRGVSREVVYGPIEPQKFEKPFVTLDKELMRLIDKSNQYTRRGFHDKLINHFVKKVTY